MKSSHFFCAELVGGYAALVSEAAHPSQMQNNEIESITQRHLELTLSPPGLF